MTLRRLLLAALAAALYASCYATIKAGLAYAPPLRFAALRALFGAFALLVLLLVSHRPLIPPRRLWLATFLLATFGPLLGFITMFMSPAHTGVALASIVGNVGPLIIIVLAAVFLGEPVTSGKLIALFLGTSGVILIAWPGAARGGHWSALLFPLMASLSGASESVIAKRAQLGTSVIAVTAWQFLLAAAPLALLSAGLESGRIEWTGSFVLALLFLAAATTAAATALWYWLVRDAEVSRLSMVLFLIPVVGLLLGTMIFGESISARQAVGVLAVLIAVAATAMLGIGSRSGEDGAASRAP